MSMHRPNITMRAWLRNATPEQKRLLSKAAKTSVPHLQHIAAGRRGMSAELAQRLAHASRSADLPKPLELEQQALCAACARCPLVRR